MLKITPDLLRSLTGCTPERADEFFADFANACAQYEINTPARLAAFFAQIGHESGSLRYVRELWGPTAAQRGYEGRADLGNVQAGDGARYLGRSLVQITGRANYAALTTRLRRAGYACPDFEAMPETLEHAPWSVIAACDFWGWKRLNALADAGDFELITRRINGGLNGYKDRKARWERAKVALAAAAAPSPTAPPAPAPRPVTPISNSQEASMGPFLIPAISALIDTVPKLGKLFGSGSEVSERNIKAAELVVDVAKTAISAPNEQALVEAIKTDPAAAQTVREAVEQNWYRLDEIGGGIQAARAANLQQSSIEPKRNMALWVTGALLPLVYMVVSAVIFSAKDVFSQDVKAMTVATVVSGVLGAITGYWLGTSFSSAKKDEQKAATP